MTTIQHFPVVRCLMIFWPLDLRMRLQGQLVHGQLFSISAMKHDLMRLKPDWAIQIVLLPLESGRIRKNKPLAFWEDFVFVTILYALFAALFTVITFVTGAIPTNQSQRIFKLDRGVGLSSVAKKDTRHIASRCKHTRCWVKQISNAL
jgi:hypothetical protein